jgi:hypothetical protein
MTVLPLLKKDLLLIYSSTIITVHNNALSQSNQSNMGSNTGSRGNLGEMLQLQLQSTTKEQLSILYSVSDYLLKLKSPHLSLILYVNTVIISTEVSIHTNNLKVDPNSQHNTNYLDILSHTITIINNVAQTQLKPVKQIFGFGGLVYLLDVLYQYGYSLVEIILIQMIKTWRLNTLSNHLFKQMLSSLPNAFNSALSHKNTKNKNNLTGNLGKSVSGNVDFEFVRIFGVKS